MLDAIPPSEKPAEVKKYEVFEGESIYRCNTCGGLYKRRGNGMAMAGCLVMHAPYDCCHLGEEMLEPPKYQIKKVPLK